MKKKGSKSSNVVKATDKNGIAEEQGVVKGVQLLANKEFNKETGGYQSESEEDEDADAVENTSGGNALSKKRKASERLGGSKYVHSLFLTNPYYCDSYISTCQL